MDKIIENQASYQEVMDFLVAYEDIDDMLLASLEKEEPAIKIISSNSEETYNYDNFLEIFDRQGLDGFVF